MKETWMFPCNPKYFDIDEHFKTNKVVVFKMNSTTSLGDTAYIYISGTLKRLKYKCKIIDTDVKEPLLSEHKYVVKPDNPYALKKPKYVAMELIKELGTDEYDLTWLRDHGTTQFINPIRLSKDVIKELEK